MSLWQRLNSFVIVITINTVVGVKHVFSHLYHTNYVEDQIYSNNNGESLRPPSSASSDLTHTYEKANLFGCTYTRNSKLFCSTCTASKRGDIKVKFPQSN